MQNNETPPNDRYALFKARVLSQASDLEQVIFKRVNEVDGNKEKNKLLKCLVSVSKRLKSLVS